MYTYIKAKAASNVTLTILGVSKNLRYNAYRIGYKCIGMHLAPWK